MINQNMNTVNDINNGFTFVRNSNATNNGVLTFSQNARYEPAQAGFGNGILIEEASTNLWANGGFSDGTYSGWTNYSVSSIGTRTVSKHLKYGNILTFDKTDAGAGVGSRLGLSQSKTWDDVGARLTDTVYIRINSATNGSYFQVYSDYNTTTGVNNGAGILLNLYTGVINTGAHGTATMTDVGDGWKKIVYTSTNLVISGASYIWTHGTESNVDVAWCQKEAKTYSTSFTESTRLGENVNINTGLYLNKDEGTIEFKVKPIAIKDWNNFFSMIISTGRFLIYFDALGMIGFDYGAQNTGLKAPQATVKANQWISLAVRWSVTSGQYSLFANGSLIGSVAFTPPTSLPSSANLTNNYSHVITDLRLSNKARTDQEIIDGYNSGIPLPSDANTTLKLDFNKPDKRRVVRQLGL